MNPSPVIVPYPSEDKFAEALTAWQAACPAGGNVTGVAIVTKTIAKPTWSVNYQPVDFNIFPEGKIEYLSRIRALLASSSPTGCALLEVQTVCVSIQDVIYHRWQARYRVSKPKCESSRESSVKIPSYTQSGTARVESTRTQRNVIPTSPSDCVDAARVTQHKGSKSERSVHVAESANLKEESTLNQLAAVKTKLIKWFKSQKVHDCFFARRRIRRKEYRTTPEDKGLIAKGPIQFVPSSTETEQPPKIRSSGVAIQPPDYASIECGMLCSRFDRCGLKDIAALREIARLPKTRQRKVIYGADIPVAPWAADCLIKLQYPLDLKLSIHRSIYDRILRMKGLDDVYVSKFDFDDSAVVGMAPLRRTTCF